MLSNSLSLNNPIKAFAAAIGIAATVLFLTALPASADSGGPATQVLSYLNGGSVAGLLLPLPSLAQQPSAG